MSSSDSEDNVVQEVAASSHSLSPSEESIVPNKRSVSAVYSSSIQDTLDVKRSRVALFSTVPVAIKFNHVPITNWTLGNDKLYQFEQKKDGLPRTLLRDLAGIYCLPIFTPFWCEPLPEDMYKAIFDLFSTQYGEHHEAFKDKYGGLLVDFNPGRLPDIFTVPPISSSELPLSYWEQSYDQDSHVRETKTVNNTQTRNRIEPKMLTKYAPKEITDFLVGLGEYFSFGVLNKKISLLASPLNFIAKDMVAHKEIASSDSKGTVAVPWVIANSLLLHFSTELRSQGETRESWFADLREQGKNSQYPREGVQFVDAKTGEFLALREVFFLQVINRWEAGILLFIFPQSLETSKFIYDLVLHSGYLSRSSFEMANKMKEEARCPFRLLKRMIADAKTYVACIRTAANYAGADVSEVKKENSSVVAGSLSISSSSNGPSKKSKKKSKLNKISKKSESKGGGSSKDKPPSHTSSTEEERKQFLLKQKLIDDSGKVLKHYCFNCGREGHYKSKCRLTKPDKSPFHFAIEKVSFNFNTLLSHSNSIHFSVVRGTDGANNFFEGPYLVFDVSHPSGEMSVNTAILIDSGADKDFISKKFINFLKLKFNFSSNNSLNSRLLLKLSEKEKFVVTYSDGVEETVTEKINLSLDRNGISVKIDFFVLNTEAINMCLGYATSKTHKFLSEIEVSGMNLETISLEEREEPDFDTETIFYSINAAPPKIFEEIQVDDSFSMRKDLLKLINKYQSLFENDLKNRCIRGYKARIETFSEESLNKQKLRKFPVFLSNYIEEEVKRLLEAEVIEASRSPFFCNVVPVKKPDGEYRICQNYINLNRYTKDFVFPLPFISETLNRLSENSFFSKLDLRNGFYQLELEEKDRYRTAFITSSGVYHFKRMPFGLKNAPSFFQEAMSRILAGLLHIACVVYLDDILIFGKTEKEMLSNLEKVFTRLEEANVSLKASKCSFGLEKINYLGHIISCEGKELSLERKDKVLQLKDPTSFSELRTALGMAAAFGEFIKDYANIAKPLTEKSGKKSKNVPFEWSLQMKESWHKIQEGVRNAQLLHRVKENSVLVLRTDASDLGVGAVLYQIVPDSLNPSQVIEEPIAFTSQAFSEVAARWSTFEKEAYACLHAIKKWEDRLLGRRFILETDHKNLLYLKESSSPKVVRWRMFLQQFNFELIHIPGKLNVVADALSRLVVSKVALRTVTTRSHFSLPEEERKIIDELGSSSEEEVDVVRTEEEEEKVKLNYKKRGRKKKVEASAENSLVPESLVILESPSSLDQKKELFIKFHNTEIGHLGYFLTIQLLKDNGFCWQGMTKDIKDFVKSCPICQKIKSPKSPYIQRRFSSSTYPFERILIDPVGPFPEDAKGNKYIYVATCGFSRFVELAAVPALSAVNMANFLIANIIPRYGMPKVIQTDGGTDLVNSLTRSLMKYFRTTHHVITPHHPQANGITERKNAEILKHLRALIIEEDSEPWSSHLGIVMRILNYTFSTSLNTYPARLVFGDRAHMDAGDEETYISDLGDILADNYVSALNDELVNLVRRSYEYLRKRFEEVVKKESLRYKARKKVSYTVGSYVLIRYPVSPPSKLAPTWAGPYLVLKVENDTLTVHNLVTGADKRVHAERIKPFFSDGKVIYEAFAARDYVGTYLLQEVVSAHNIHKPSAHDASFVVRWVGYPGTYNQSYDGLQDSSVFHDFVKKHPTMKKKLTKWIPKKYLILDQDEELQNAQETELDDLP